MRAVIVLPVEIAPLESGRPVRKSVRPSRFRPDPASTPDPALVCLDDLCMISVDGTVVNASTHKRRSGLSGPAAEKRSRSGPVSTGTTPDLDDLIGKDADFQQHWKRFKDEWSLMPIDPLPLPLPVSMPVLAPVPVQCGPVGNDPFGDEEELPELPENWEDEVKLIDLTPLVSVEFLHDFHDVDF